MFPGIKATPFIRYYTGSNPLSGFYIQSKIYFGFFMFEDHHSWFSNGLGLNFGNQWLTGHRGNIAIDLNFGFKVVTFSKERIAGYWFNGLHNMEDFWYSTGPGSYFDGHFGIGFIF